MKGRGGGNYERKRSDLYYLLYILNLPKLPMTTEQKTPNMGKIQAKCDQTAKSVAGYK